MEQPASTTGTAPPGTGGSRSRTLVVGGGISGLTVAYRLHRAGHDVLLLEGSGRFGGVIRTRAEGGWLFEEGPNTVLAGPALTSLIDELGLREVRLDASTAAATRFVVRNGRMVPLPTTPPAFLASPLFSAGGKLRLFREPFIPRGRNADESIAEFTRRRLGGEFLDYAVGPFVSGVYAGDPEKLSARHAVRKIKALEEAHGSLIRGAIALRKTREAGAPRGSIVSFRNGLETLPGALAARLGGRARPGARVESIAKTPAGFQVRVSGSGTTETLDAGRVILTLDAAEAGRLLEPLASAAAPNPGRLADVPYAGVAIVELGYRRADVGHSLRGFGVLVPTRERLGILGALFTSSFFPGRAPDGHVAITVIAGGATDPQAVHLSENDLRKRATDALEKLLGTRGAPVHSNVVRWPRAIPQYNVGHQEFLDLADRLETENPGLFLGGNWRRGVSVQDCVENTAALASRIGAPSQERS